VVFFFFAFFKKSAFDLLVWQSIAVINFIAQISIGLHGDILDE
jgi:hypothetical protein